MSAADVAEALGIGWHVFHWAAGERSNGSAHEEPDDAPEGFREQPRYAPTVERMYANDRIEVTWEPAFCIHVAECMRGLPAVFDNQRRPLYCHRFDQHYQLHGYQCY